MMNPSSSILPCPSCPPLHLGPQPSIHAPWSTHAVRPMHLDRASLPQTNRSPIPAPDDCLAVLTPQTMSPHLRPCLDTTKRNRPSRTTRKGPTKKRPQNVPPGNLKFRMPPLLTTSPPQTRENKKKLQTTDERKENTRRRNLTLFYPQTKAPETTAPSPPSNHAPPPTPLRRYKRNPASDPPAPQSPYPSTPQSNDRDHPSDEPHSRGAAAPSSTPTRQTETRPCTP